MKNIADTSRTSYQLMILVAVLFIAACGNKEGDKKSELEKLKKQASELKVQIAALEAEVASTDSTSTEKSRMVAITKITPTLFNNYIQVQGRVDADENVSLSPEMGGNITKINVKPGDAVQAGQILAEVDNRVILQGIAELQNGLDLAKILFEKQKNLWEQKIGTEVQYLSAKNQKESLEKKMATLQQQLDMSRIKSPINGFVDAVDIKLGQMAAPGMPAIRVVNTSNLKVKGEVAESYASKIKSGNVVDIIFPDMADTIHSKVSYSAKVINMLNRTFNVEVRLDNTREYHPNMVAIMKIVDYSNPQAFVIPVSTIQHTEQGDYVLLAEKNKVKKQYVKVGRSYNGNAEITSGLKENDLLITKGFQELNEGELVSF